MGKANIYQDLWGSNETIYSAFIAQTIFLCPKFNRYLKEKCGIPIETEMIRIVTEEVFNPKDRIDIFIEYEGFLLGIENKKWAGLQSDQLLRYFNSIMKASEQRQVGKKPESRLLFLAPSRYHLPSDQAPKGMIKIDYRQIIDFFKNYKLENEFETRYVESAIEFLEVLEMKGISQEEIEALQYAPKINNLNRKLKQILLDLRNTGNGDGPIETSSNNYLLFFQRINSYYCYIGFRFSMDWYCDQPLLNGKAECIVYVKDIWDEQQQEEFNKNLKERFHSLREEVEKLDFNNDVNIYDRKKQNECRIVIRRNLSDFANSELSEVVQWFSNIILVLKKAL